MALTIAALLILAVALPANIAATRRGGTGRPGLEPVLRWHRPAVYLATVLGLLGGLAFVALRRSPALIVLAGLIVVASLGRLAATRWPDLG